MEYSQCLYSIPNNLSREWAKEKFLPPYLYSISTADIEKEIKNVSFYLSGTWRQVTMALS